MGKNYTIIVDTREQKPLWNKGIKIKGLSTGDYSIDGYEDKICIERKSIGDLFGTLGQGNKRFKKELERGRELDYFAIIIEGSFRDVRDKNFDGSYHTKMKGYVIIKILFTLIVKYKIHVFFCNDRNESRAVIKQLFEAYLRKEEK